jgi:hypothetical protein
MNCDSRKGRQVGRLGVRFRRADSMCAWISPRVQWAWQHFKHVELRNVTCLDPEKLQMQLHLAIGRLRQKPDIVRSFFAGAGLQL